MNGLFMFIIICLLTFAGCSNAHQASFEEVKFLTCVQYWYHYDEVTGENEKMSFSEDFTFYWGYECGEPIGNSDLYERYNYDKERKIIRVYNEFDDCSMEMKVLDYSEYHLLLEVEGKIKGYTCEDLGLFIKESEKYLSGYNSYSSIIKGNTQKVILGPCNYDGDVKYPDNAMKTYLFAEDAEFFDLNITTIVKDEQEHENVSYEKLSREEAVSCMEDTFAFIWFNDEMQIKKLTFYGATYIN